MEALEENSTSYEQSVMYYHVIAIGSDNIYAFCIPKCLS